MTENVQSPRTTLLSALCLGLAACMTPQSNPGAAPAPTTAQSSSVDARVATLHKLLDEQWEYNLRNSPEFASILGDKRYNDRLSDFSQAAIDRDNAQTKVFLREFEAVDAAGFPEQERLNRDLMVRNLRESVEAQRFKEWEMPVNQMNGLHIDLPQLITSLSFETVKDYDDYIARLKQFPRAFGEAVVQMRKGMADGLMPPKILLVQVVSQAGNIAVQKAEDTPFAIPTTQFPKEFSAADQARLRNGVLAAIRDSVLPSYAKFTAFVRDEYAPRGRLDIGTWALPDGAARYAFDVRRSTTTNMTPDEIHQLGLREVARIETEQLAIAKKLGFADLKSFRDSIPKMPSLHPKSREQILDEYRHYIAQMTARLPELFGRLPKAKLEVLPIEPFREKEASTSYNQGTPDGSRPGHVFVNTYDFANQLIINNESTAYHEGVPGHHMQISIAQELPELPPFRQLHRICGGLGPLRRAIGEGDRILPESVHRLRTSRRRDAPRNPPGGGHRDPRQALDARAGRGRLPRALEHERRRDPVRNGSLHRATGASARIQNRTAKDSRAAHARGKTAGHALRRS